jgi:hypothetical protein
MVEGRGSFGPVTLGKGFCVKGQRMRFLDVTLRFQRGRTSVSACMTNPGENAPHKLHSGHTVSIGIGTETGTHNCKIYTAHTAQWTHSEYRQQNRNWNT